MVPACGLPLAGADLRPIARKDGPPGAVTVSAGAASQDLLFHSDEQASEESTLALRVHLFNDSAATRTETPTRYRLNVVGADGRPVTGTAVAWVEEELPRAMPAPFPSGKPQSIAIPPGRSATIAVFFRGLTGLTLSGAARIELVLPDGRTVVVSAPTTPSPQWTPWQKPRSLLLRAGISWHGANQLTEIGLQAIVARGPLIFGMTILDHVDLLPRQPDRPYVAGGLGLFVGVQPRVWPGLVAGADGMYGTAHPLEGGSWLDLWMVRTYAAVRFQGGRSSGMGGGAVPIRRDRPSFLRSATIDVGYSHTFVRGDYPSGGGLLLVAGAPLFGF
jgi:hypothetical protein